MVFENPEDILRRSKQLLRAPKERTRQGSENGGGEEEEGAAAAAAAAQDGDVVMQDVGQGGSQHAEEGVHAAGAGDGAGTSAQGQQELLPLPRLPSQSQPRHTHLLSSQTPDGAQPTHRTRSEQTPLAGMTGQQQQPQSQQQPQQGTGVGQTTEGGLPNVDVPSAEPRALARSKQVVQQLVAATEGWMVGPLEVLHVQVCVSSGASECLLSPCFFL